uniref:CCHC-type domain-containing protein n=1 Tax=Cucumis melo TaxID=3656 RepID=A0A9I9E8H8_CUCME
MGVPGGSYYIVGLVNVGCTVHAVHHVEIELPVPDTLPTSAESSGSNSIGSTRIVRGDNVCWLHAVFWAKTAGGPGGGVMPPRTSRRRRQNQDRMQDPTQGQSERGSSTPRGQNEAGSERFVRSAQEIVTAIAKWTDFSQLIETALRVEQSIVEEKSAMELSRGVSTTSRIRGREQRRSTPGVNISGCQDFKRRLGGKPLRQMSSGSAYQRQSQRASSQFTNSVARPRTGQESVASESRRTPCVSCSKSHRGQCLVGAGVCYQCGQTGHFKRDCPQLRVGVQRDQGVESHTVEQPRILAAAREGTSEQFEERMKEEEEDFRRLRLKKIGKSSCKASHSRIWVQLSTSEIHEHGKTKLSMLENKLPVPDTLPTSAESFGSNSSTWLELYFESIHVEMFCKDQQGSLEKTMSVGFTPSFGLRQHVVREGIEAQIDLQLQLPEDQRPRNLKF